MKKNICIILCLFLFGGCIDSNFMNTVEDTDKPGFSWLCMLNGRYTKVWNIEYFDENKVVAFGQEYPYESVVSFGNTFEHTNYKKFKKEFWEHWNCERKMVMNLPNFYGKNESFTRVDNQTVVDNTKTIDNPTITFNVLPETVVGETTNE